jgi:hypothetical protein
MRPTLLFSLACAFLIGCAKTPQVVQVQVPVPVPCPEPPAVSRPALPIAQLQAGASIQEVLRAYAATVALLEGYAGQLETLLDGYRPAAPGATPSPAPQEAP